MERRIAEGTGIHTPEPGQMILWSRAIASANPQLSGIVDAVAQHQIDHADEYKTWDEDSTAELVRYGLIIANLLARPDLATPEVISAFEQAARSAGLIGVIRLIGADPTENGGIPMRDLQDVIAAQEHAIREFREVPNADCSDEPTEAADEG